MATTLDGYKVCALVQTQQQAMKLTPHDYM